MTDIVTIRYTTSLGIRRTRKFRVHESLSRDQSELARFIAAKIERLPKRCSNIKWEKTPAQERFL